MLSKIIKQKTAEVELLKQTINTLKPLPNKAQEISSHFRQANGIGVIAELKRSSPLKGELNSQLNLIKTAQDYEQNGAMAISVITDRTFFKGEPNFLPAVKSAVSLPILRKDFIIDEIQLYETVNLDADLVLLIAAILSYDKLLHFSELSLSLGLEPLVEIHTLSEAKLIQDLPIKLVGVNNRNLNNFKVDISNSLKLAPYLPQEVFKISESGIKSPYDLNLLAQYDYNAALIGESLVTSPSPGLKLKKLLNYSELQNG